MGHALSDTVKIVLVVIAPVLFFALLFTSAFLYRRYRSPRSDQHWHSRTSTPTCTQPVSNQPKSQCQTCDTHRQITLPTSDKFGTTGEFGSSSSALFASKDRQGSISQPHFEERSIPIRRISSNPYGVDEIQRLHSVSSTLNYTSEHEEDSLAARSSSETLPAHLSHAQQRRKSSLLPLYDGTQVGYMDDRKDVVTLGERRPSVLSAGTELVPEGDGHSAIGSLPLRRVSAGGVEDVVIIHGPGSQSTSLVKSDRGTESNARPPVPPLPLDMNRRLKCSAIAPTHPFSARSLSRTSTTTTRVSSPATQRARPESLTLVPSSTPHCAATAPTMSTKDSNPTKSAISTKGNRSPATAALTSRWSVSDIETPTPITGGLFEAWKGFPPKVNVNTKATLHPHRSSVPVSVPTLNLPQQDPSSQSIVTTAASASTNLTIPVEDKRSSTLSNSSRNSRITYLADIVKDGAEAQAQAREHGRKSIVSEYAPVIPFPRDVDPSAHGEIGHLPKVL